jgi:hypothetical protein
MYREKRAVSLVILTLFVYASTIFLDYNSFVLPFPIFDFILIILAIQFAVWNFKDLITFRKWYYYVYMVALIFKLLMNPILWGFLLDELEMESFLNKDYLDYFKLFYSLICICVFVCWSYVEKLKMSLLWVSVISIIQVFGLFELSYAGMFIGYGLFAGYVLFQRPRNSLSFILVIHGTLDLLSLSMLMLS